MAKSIGVAGPNTFDLWTIVISQGDIHVEGRVTEDIALSLQSEFGSLFDSDNSGLVGKFLSTANLSTQTELASRQIWKGSTLATFTFELIFIAENDPKKDVRDKIVALYKLAVPRIGTAADVEKLSAPAKFVNKLGKFAGLLRPPQPVNVQIGSGGQIISLDNYFVTDVNFTQSMKLVRKRPPAGSQQQLATKGALPMKAQGTITLIPGHILLDNDIENIFK